MHIVPTELRGLLESNNFDLSKLNTYDRDHIVKINKEFVMGINEDRVIKDDEFINHSFVVHEDYVFVPHGIMVQIPRMPSSLIIAILASIIDSNMDVEEFDLNEKFIKYTRYSIKHT